MIGRAELDALLRERGGLLDQPLGGAAAPRRDHQPLVAEPRVRERHAVALGADQLRGGHADVVERDDRVGVGVRVRVPRLAHQADARRVLVDDEHRVLALVLAADELRLEEEVVGAVVRRHVHLLAVQHVVVAVASRGGLDRVDVGAGARLGDRVALVALAADRRLQPPLDLLVGHRPRAPTPAGVCTHQPSAFVTRPICSETRTCCSIVNPPPPRSFGRFIARTRARCARSLVRRALVLGDLAVVLLGVLLPRDQLLVDERAGCAPGSRGRRRRAGRWSWAVTLAHGHEARDSDRGLEALERDESVGDERHPAEAVGHVGALVPVTIVTSRVGHV